MKKEVKFSFLASIIIQNRSSDKICHTLIKV